MAAIADALLLILICVVFYKPVIVLVRWAIKRFGIMVSDINGDGTTENKKGSKNG